MRIARSFALAALISTTAIAQGSQNYPPTSSQAYPQAPRAGTHGPSVEERRERKKARRQKLAAMTPAQRQAYDQRKQAKRNKLAAMTPQQRDAYKQRRAERREAKEEAARPR